MKALVVERLSVRVRGRYLLKEVTFSVEEGDIVAIIGPNGAGKTTLIKAILRLIPSTGEISIFGGRGTHVRVGYVPQDFEFDRTFPLTVSELLRFSLPPILSIPLLHRTDIERIDEVLEITGIRSLAHRTIGSLSGGELQRVLIARAILNNPAILFLDEPATGIDLEGQERFYDLISRLRRERGMTILLVSHDLNIVYRHADNVLCLNQRLICQGRPEETLTDEVVKGVYGDMMGTYTHRRHGQDC